MERFTPAEAAAYTHLQQVETAEAMERAVVGNEISLIEVAIALHEVRLAQIHYRQAQVHLAQLKASTLGSSNHGSV